MTYYVITILLFLGSATDPIGKVYNQTSFNASWACHQYIHMNKMKLLTPHILKHSKDLKSFEFFCEERFAPEV